jgi:hypothetical protein
MANPITKNITLGTIGELLVQLRLLQFDVQAAPPLKDSGNDLIAIRGSEMRTIQIKATKAHRPRFPQKKRHYHLLALVHLRGYDRELQLDRSDVYLVPQEQLACLRRSWDALAQFKLTEDYVSRLFQQGGVGAKPAAQDGPSS